MKDLSSFHIHKVKTLKNFSSFYIHKVKTVNDFSSFYIHKALYEIAGLVKNASRLGWDTPCRNKNR